MHVAGTPPPVAGERSLAVQSGRFRSPGVVRGCPCQSAQKPSVLRHLAAPWCVRTGDALTRVALAGPARAVQHFVCSGRTRLSALEASSAFAVRVPGVW